MVIMLVVFMVIVGLAGLALDLARLRIVRQQVQNSMDATTLAAASAMWLNGAPTGSLPTMDRVRLRAEQTAAENAFDLNKRRVRIKWEDDVKHSATFDGAFARGSGVPNTRYIRVQKSVEINNYFWGLLGSDYQSTHVGGFAVAGFSNQKVERVPPNTTPILPLGIVVVGVNTLSCGQEIFLRYVRASTPPAPPMSLDVWAIVPLDINASRAQMLNRIENGFLNNPPFTPIYTRNQYGSIPLGQLPAAFGANSVQSRFANRFNADTDRRASIRYSTSSPGYNEREPREGNGRRILVLPEVRGTTEAGLGGPYEVLSYAAFFQLAPSGASGTVDVGGLPHPYSEIRVQFICNYTIPHGTVGGRTLDEPPYREITRLQLFR